MVIVIVPYGRIVRRGNYDEDRVTRNDITFVIVLYRGVYKCTKGYCLRCRISLVQKKRSEKVNRH